MKSRATKGFWHLHNALPKHIQERAARAYRLWLGDPGHPSLEFKRVGNSPPTYSARISKDYRMLGTLSGDTVIWHWIGSHSDYDAILARRHGFSEEAAEYEAEAGFAAWPVIGDRR